MSSDQFKKTILSLAVVVVLGWLVLAVIGATAPDAIATGALIVGTVCLLAAGVLVPWAGFLYWRDWYRRGRVAEH